MLDALAGPMMDGLDTLAILAIMAAIATAIGLAALPTTNTQPAYAGVSSAKPQSDGPSPLATKKPCQTWNNPKLCTARARRRRGNTTLSFVYRSNDCICLILTKIFYDFYLYELLGLSLN